jgi:Flp pilus assembly protein TadG
MTTLFRHRIRRKLFREFAGAEKGLSLLEFALIFPLMIMLFLGLVEFGEAFAVSRKLTNAASSVSDLVSQVPEITTSDLDDIARVAEAIIEPYRTANLGLVVTSVQADAQGNLTVGWSYAHGAGATGRTQGAAMNLPAGLVEPGSSIIVAETAYQFTPTVGFFLTGTIPLSGVAYFRPRVAAAVAYNP